MRDTDRLCELQKRGRAKAYTQVFQAAGAVSRGAAHHSGVDRRRLSLGQLNSIAFANTVLNRSQNL